MGVVMLDELRFIDLGRLENAATAELIRYQVSVTGGTRVESMPARRDPALAPDTIRFAAGDAILVVVLEDWLGREVWLRQHVREWILAHVSLHKAKVRERAPDREWALEVIRANGPQ